MPKYGHKSIYVPDFQKWDEVAAIAKSQGYTMSHFIMKALDDALKPDKNALKLQRIKSILEE